MLVFILGLFVICYLNVNVNSETVNDSVSDDALQKAFLDCLDTNSVLSCLAEKASRAVDRYIKTDIEIIEGIRFLRNNNSNINFRKPRSESTLQRLSNSLSRFANTHSISINLTESEGRNRKGLAGGGGGGGGGGFFNFDRKAIKRETRYSKYAFMVLLGIFGLTGPLFMKILAVVAAQALMASKAALIIVGSIALKKLFEKKEEKPSVKVATIPLHDADEGDHDRLSFGNDYYPHVYYYQTKDDTSPYSGHNEIIYKKDDYAPLYYGKLYKTTTITKTR